MRDEPRSYSVRQLARHWAVAPEKVRELIRRGILHAIDLGFGRRQLRITPEAILECERRLAVKASAPRRKRQTDIDPEIMKLLDQ